MRVAQPATWPKMGPTAGPAQRSLRLGQASGALVVGACASSRSCFEVSGILRISRPVQVCSLGRRGIGGETAGVQSER
jgi:hypothetical protein